MTPPSHGHDLQPAAEQRRRALRNRRFARRRAVAAVLVLLLLTGLALALRWAWGRLATGSPGGGTADLPSSAPVTALAFKPETLLPAGDLNGDQVEEQVALSPASGGQRQAALVTGKRTSLKQVGQAISVGTLSPSVADLPGAGQVLLLSGRRSAAAAPRTVEIPGGSALEVSGGEPSFQAWQLNLKQGLVPVNFYEAAAPATPPFPTMILVDKWLNVLWYFENGKLALTARAATGKFLEGPAPSVQNQAVNLVTPVGHYTISLREENPVYMKDAIPGGDPANPLGTRWLGFSVYDGDRSRVWGIHGTNEPDSIGLWSSTGCIRLANADVERLFARVKEGTVLQIISSQPSQ